MKRRASSAIAACVSLTALVLAMIQVDFANAQERSPFVHYKRLDVATPDGGTQRVILTWPRRAQLPDGFWPNERLPVLIALHGLKEAQLVPSRGVLAWKVDYHLDDAFGALMHGNLTEANFGNLVTQARLNVVNAALRAHPFHGVIVATPYTPPLIDEPVGSDKVKRYGDWLAGPVLEQIRREVPAARTRLGAGIDGVSLGGRLALEIGFAHSDVFSTVGALQPAIQPDMIETFAAGAANALSHGNPQTVSLVTSEHDAGRDQALALANALRARHISHELLQTPGEHGYAFNRGPGGIEMLLFAERHLQRENTANSQSAP